jgi:hypothetical protein
MTDELNAAAKVKVAKPWYKRKLFWFVAAIIFIAIAANAGSSSKGGNSETTSSTANSNSSNTNSSNNSGAQSALSAYFKQVNYDLSLCVAGIGATQIELSQALSSNATTSDYVSLYSAAKQAEGPCDIVQNNDLLNLGTMDPPSGYPSLNSFSIDAQTWADSDSVTVLKDVEAVANNPSSTADTANLLDDSQSADADGRALVEEAGKAAAAVGIKNTGGNEIIYWGLTEK